MNRDKRKTDEVRKHQKESRKLDSTCISRMYTDEYEDGKVSVRYISAHTGHDLGPQEIKFLPLPESTKEQVAIKISAGIPVQRILQGNVARVGLCNPAIACMCIQIHEKPLVTALSEGTLTRV